MNESFSNIPRFEMPTTSQASEFAVRAGSFARLGVSAGFAGANQGSRKYEQPISAEDIALLDPETKLHLQAGQTEDEAHASYHVKATGYDMSTAVQLTRSVQNQTTTSHNKVVFRTARRTGNNTVGLVWDFAATDEGVDRPLYANVDGAPDMSYGSEAHRESSLLNSRLIPSKQQMAGILALLKQHTFEL